MNKRIVVWSDYPYVARTVSASLPEGYDVSNISFDDVSLQNVRELLPHLVVLDPPSRGRNVAALCEELQQDEPTRGIRMLVLEGSFDRASSLGLDGLSSRWRLSKPFTIERLRERIEAVLSAPAPTTAPTRESRVAPEAVSISDEELDRALDEALKELDVGPEAEAPPEVPELEEFGIGPDEIDEAPHEEDGVGPDESEELLAAATVSPEEVSKNEEKRLEAEAVTEQETEGKRTLEDEEFLARMIDSAVDSALERVGAELKASLKRSLTENMRRMARRAVQDLLPKLSERLIAEMFKSEGENR